MRASLGSAFLVVVSMLWIIGPARVSAACALRGVSNNSETIWIGMVNRPGDGTSNVVAAACFDDGPGGTSTVWTTIGNTTGLTEDCTVHGDSTDAGTGSDIMRLIPTNGSNPTGACGTYHSTNNPNGEALSTWNVLGYAGWLLDMWGDGGNDEMLDGGGSNDTWMYGGAGADYLVQGSSHGAIFGEADGDTLYGITSGGNDRLTGGTGADCLWDSTNTFVVFDCGNNAGDTRNSSNTGTTGCPNSDACCGLC